MSRITKMIVATGVIAFVAGGMTGWLLARPASTGTQQVPEHWVARIDDQYISDADFIEEMRRRGGQRPGQYQDMEQRRQLLDDLVYRAALVRAAERAGLTAQPDLRRMVDQLVSNRYLQGTLRRAERDVQVTREEIEAYYAKHQDDYTVPARKRVAVLRIAVAPDAGEPAWKEAIGRMQEARGKVDSLATTVPHFGNLAREYSDDTGSRYRGGVIGWISEGRSDRYSHDPVVLEATRTLEQAGALSAVLRGGDGVYLVRLVESEPRQSRSLEQLASGIRQRLLQERLAATEQEFRQRLMREVGVEVRESVLASIAPLSAPGKDAIPQPPAMPVDQG